MSISFFIYLVHPFIPPKASLYTVAFREIALFLVNHSTLITISYQTPTSIYYTCPCCLVIHLTQTRPTKPKAYGHGIVPDYTGFVI